MTRQLLTLVAVHGKHGALKAVAYVAQVREPPEVAGDRTEAHKVARE